MGKYNIVILCLWVIVLFVGCINCTTAYNQVEPFELTDSNFDEIVDSYKNTIVLFSHLTDNGCSRCKIAEFEIAELLAEETEDVLDVFVATVNCKQFWRLCQEYDLQDVDIPNIKLFSGLGIYEYPYTNIIVYDIIDFVNEYTIDKYSLITSKKEFDDFVTGSKLSVVGAFSESEQQLKYRESYMRTSARLFKTFAFGIIDLKEEEEQNEEINDLLEEYGIEKGDVTFFSYLGDELLWQHYGKEISRKRLTNWMFKVSPWLVEEIIDFNDFVERVDNILTIYLDYDDVETKEQIIYDMESVVTKFQHKIFFTYKKADEEITHQLQRYGYSTEHFPIMVLYNRADGIYTFPENQDVNAESIESFCRSYMEGDLSPHEIKQEIQEQSVNDPVTVLVHDNFRDIVFSNELNVFVLYYLPEDQCPHCITFLNEYENYARKVTKLNLPNVVFGKIDMDKNFVAPGSNVHSYPSLVFYPAFDKYKESTFTLKRNEEHIAQWVSDVTDDIVSEQLDNSSFNQFDPSNIIV